MACMCSSGISSDAKDSSRLTKQKIEKNLDRQLEATIEPQKSMKNFAIYP